MEGKNMVSVICEKRQSENGDCSLERAPPKYKRRKVSAIRDFPPGCGRDAEPINIRKKEVEDDGQKIYELSKDVDRIREKGVDFSEVESKGVSERTVDSRFPDIPACLNVDEKEISSFLKSDNEHRSEQVPNLAVHLGSDGISKEQTLENPKSSQDLQKLEKESMLKDETHDLSKGLMEVRVDSPRALENTGMLDLKEDGNHIESGMVVQATNVEQCLLPHHPIPANLVWKERKYPPRRRVSAIRDLPPGCGRGAPRLSEYQDKRLGENETDVSTYKEEVPNDDNKTGKDFDADVMSSDKTKGVVLVESGEKLEAKYESETGDCGEIIMQVSDIGKYSEIRGQEQISELKNDKQHAKETVESGYGKDERDVGGLGNNVNKELIVYVKDKHKKKKSTGIFCINLGLQEESAGGFNYEEAVVVVQGLISPRNCPWRRGKKAFKSTPSSNSVKLRQGMKHDYTKQDKHTNSPSKSKDKVQSSKERFATAKPNLPEKEIDDFSRKLDLRDEGDSSENDELDNNFQLVPRKRDFDVSLPPFGAGSSGERGIRSKVRETLRLFQTVVRKLQQGEETKPKDQKNASTRVDLRAARILKDHGKYINTGKQILGPVPGVEVGDEFHYRIELAIIGLHRPLQSGIDYVKRGQKIIATSIVASGGYANDVESSDVLIYTGQGGNATGGDKQPEDQKLERGNLSLKNSVDEKNFVRVIRGFKETKPSDKTEGRPKILATYTYDGLYTVEKYWQDLGSHGKLVYKFELRRLPGQPELAWKEVKKSKKFKVREGLCVEDISGGKERFPICAVNTIDDEKPPPFTYITTMMYPDWCLPVPPRGCDCKDECSDSEHCACAVKNGGEIPYNYDGAIVEAKPLVYECGPNCKCPSSCYNRVSQHGIKFPLEIFKTESRGWGIRSLSSIPSGSFICEYIGELLDDKEAEQRTGNDEYLFDIGQNYNDLALSDGLSALMPDMHSSSSDVVEDVGFTIDAAQYGNIGRFINHSCSPNLYAQNVLYDHDDKRIPHVMLFAAENIPPLQELTYHYNYTIDQVFDSDGNIRKKNCYCGSSECTGRMY